MFASIFVFFPFYVQNSLENYSTVSFFLNGDLRSMSIFFSLNQFYFEKNKKKGKMLRERKGTKIDVTSFFEKKYLINEHPKIYLHNFFFYILVFICATQVYIQWVVSISYISKMRIFIKFILCILFLSPSLFAYFIIWFILRIWFSLIRNMNLQQSNRKKEKKKIEKPINCGPFNYQEGPT